MTSTESYKKMLEINSLFNSFENLDKKDYRGWWNRLNTLKIELCDTPYWGELMDSMDFCKSKMN